MTGLSCAWCLAPLPAPLLTERVRFQAVPCLRCGCATTVPHPTSAELDEAYGDWYRPARGRFSYGADRVLSHLRGRLALSLDRDSPPGPVLDVGCGDGSLLDALHRRGRAATGLERESTRPDVRNEDIADIETGWAAAVFWHSLEHLAEPRTAVREAARMLIPGGLLVIAVPNVASIQARLFGPRWFHLDLPRHLVHFSAQALRDGLVAEGFELISLSHTRGGQVVFGWLQGVVGSLPGQPDLYQAMRRQAAQQTPLTLGSRLAVLATGAILWPAALLGSALEVLVERGGTICVTCRKP